ncbi:MAG: T9SS type A sorting domain-containing protein [Bacteroidetes bacterium]|nr:T9SS type A sorting domain-containing protein [Bacteroidota bacterium]
MKKTRFLILVLSIIGHAYGQVFTLVDSLQFSNAQIWGVCSDEGDSLCVTTVFSPSSQPHIFIRKVNYSVISQQSALVQLTFDVDFAAISNLTDHKTIILNNEIYIAFSTQGDQDLFLFKTDINGNRIGSIVPVVSGSADPTNDMILVTDGTYIYVLHFDPPFQHHVYKFDSNLNAVGSPISTTTLTHNNIGHSVYRNNTFHLFTGSIFGFNSNLTHTTWNNSWGAISSQNILSSTGGDGNFFSTGAIFDSTNQRWYIALNHIYNGQSIGQEHIDLLSYDSNFNLLERKHVTAKNYTRPHLVLKGGYLYMTYDKPGAGVYLHKYQLQNTAGIDQLSNLSNSIQVFPNPFSMQTTLQTDSPMHNATLLVDNCFGQTVAQIKNINGQTVVLSRDNLARGLYFARLTQDSKVIATKTIIITD